MKTSKNSTEEGYKKQIKDMLESRTPLLSFNVYETPENYIELKFYAGGVCFVDTHGKVKIYTSIMNHYYVALSIAMADPSIMSGILKEGKESNFLASILRSISFKSGKKRSSQTK